MNRAEIDTPVKHDLPFLFRFMHCKEIQIYIREVWIFNNIQSFYSLLFWLFTHKGWCYDTIPAESNPECPFELDIMESLEVVRDRNLRELCLTSSTLETRWHADFAKRYGNHLVQVETQFGQAESMFKDFCGFRIAHAEGRLALGIEIVLDDPPRHLADHHHTMGKLATFEMAKETLTTIGLDSPIWLLGIVA